MVSRLFRAFAFAGIVAFALGFVNHSDRTDTTGKNLQVQNVVSKNIVQAH